MISQESIEMVILAMVYSCLLMVVHVYRFFFMFMFINVVFHGLLMFLHVDQRFRTDQRQ